MTSLEILELTGTWYKMLVSMAEGLGEWKTLIKRSKILTEMTKFERFTV